MIEPTKRFDDVGDELIDERLEELIDEKLGASATGASARNRSAQIDLTPRQVADNGSGRRRLLPAVALVAVVAGLGFVLFQTLGDASLFFYNADQAVERRDDLVDQRFRMQGTPFGDPFAADIERDGRLQTAVVFPVNFEGVVVDVVHTGQPAEQFQPGVPVVLEGAWVKGFPAGVDVVGDGANDGWYFASTDMVVKHSNEYRTSNDDRIDDAERGGFSPEQ